MTTAKGASVPDEPWSTQARVLLESLSLPAPFSVRAFLKQIADDRAKPIVLHQIDPAMASTLGSWCGAWLDTGDADHIVFVQDVSTVKTAQTVLHECGHLLMDHAGSPVPAGFAVEGLSGASIARARGRTAFGEPDELAAEAFSTLLLRASMFSRGADLRVSDGSRSALAAARFG